MNTTTKTDWKVTVVAWGIALVACAALAWGILSVPPSSTQGTMKLPEGHAVAEHHGALKPRAARPAKLNEKMKVRCIWPLATSGPPAVCAAKCRRWSRRTGLCLPIMQRNWWSSRKYP